MAHPTALAVTGASGNHRQSQKLPKPWAFTLTVPFVTRRLSPPTKATIMSEQAKGNFTTKINRDKQPGDSKPVYEGRFTVPGTGEEYGFALFLGEDKSGRKYFSGPITHQPVNGKLDDQLSALLSAEPAKAPEGADGSRGRLFRFLPATVSPKDEPERKGEPPAFWGRAMLAAGSELLQISVWEQDSRYQINPHITKYLRGNTQFPLKG